MQSDEGKLKEGDNANIPEADKLWFKRQIAVSEDVRRNGKHEAVRAIEFALTQEDEHGGMAFLREWMVGNSHEEWPEFDTDAVPPSAKTEVHVMRDLEGCLIAG